MNKINFNKIKLTHWLNKKNDDEIYLYNYELIKSSNYYTATDIDMQIINKSDGYNSIEDKYQDKTIMLPLETNLIHVNHLFKEIIDFINKYKMKLTDADGLIQDILTLENKEDFYNFCMNNS